MGQHFALVVCYCTIVQCDSMQVALFPQASLLHIHNVCREKHFCIYNVQ